MIVVYCYATTEDTLQLLQVLANVRYGYRIQDLIT